MASEPAANESPQPARTPELAAETLGFPLPNSESAVPGDTGPNMPRARSLAGQSFGDLELLEELGRGGMGVVYKARQKSLDRFVAVKLLLAEHLTDSVRLARFYAEARAAARLDHRNIVQVYQVGECPFGHYLSMEYIDGLSLEDYIAKRRIPVGPAVAVLAAVADAVHYAHKKGIVHRDLKPANIMLDQARRPVIMDFGIAKFLGKSSSLTQQGAIVGTPAFMAPEQAGEKPDEVGPHSDVYSLGAILYSLLTSRLPYEEDTSLRTILKVIGPDMPPSIRSLRADVPRELERVCMKCLNKRPVDRFPTAKALAEDLRHFHVQRVRRKSERTMERKLTGSTMRAHAPTVHLLPHETEHRIRLRPGVSIMGRASDCEVVVRAGDVSKQHCRLHVHRGAVEVEDLASANGTYVNDERVQRAPLHQGDRLRIADHEFVVEIEMPAE
jgi:serine/threonine protein kinase